MPHKLTRFVFSLLPVGSSLRQDVIGGGGVHSSEVIMRKRSENRYTDEHIRDSIVMGDMSNKFPNLGTCPPPLRGLT